MIAVFLSPAAENDIDEIITYIAEDNPTAAQELLDSLFESMKNLGKNPEIGHTRKDITDKPVRFLLLKWHYLIIYKYKPSTRLEIVRVLSGYRDLFSLIQ